MNTPLTFWHDGKEYAADVVSSENLQPHYHWLLFRSDDMKTALGEDVAFVENDGNLKSVHPSLARRNQELFESIRAALQQHLAHRQT